MTIRTLLQGAVIASMVAGATPAMAQQPTPDQLLARSREASTVVEHAALARDFRLQAERFEAEAKAHEATAARMAQSAPPIAHKWPAMVPRVLTEARTKALDARNAARESRALADRHVRLSVEAQAASR